MITNPTRAPTQLDTWRQREQDHYDRRLTRYDVDSSPVEDGEGRLILIVAQMHANAAVRLARVRGIANSSRKGDANVIH